MNQSPQQPATTTQAQRRLRYGVNVAITILLLAAIVVLINWINYRTLRGVRTDLTELRRYTLSPQTRSVVRSIDRDVEMVALVTPGTEINDRALDLLGEFQRAGEHITTRHIDPSIDPKQAEAFQRQLHDRFRVRLKPIKAAVDQGVSQLKRSERQISAILDQVDAILEHEQFKQAEAWTRGRGLPSMESILRRQANTLRRLETKISKESIPAIEAALEGPMPQYARARWLLDQQLGTIIAEVQGLERRSASFLDPRVAPDILSGVRELTRALTEMAQDAVKDAEAAYYTNRAAEPVFAYENLIVSLSDPDTVVLLSEDREVVVTLKQKPAAQPAEDAPVAVAEYAAEDRLAGALIRFEKAGERPIVVFVTLTDHNPLAAANDTGAAPLKARYTRVAEQLRLLNFDLRLWRAAVDTQIPDIPDGRRAVWVVLPDVQRLFPNAPDAVFLQNIKKPIEHIARRLEAGDGVLLSFAPGKQAAADVTAGATDPRLQLIESWGISVQTDKVLIAKQPESATGDPMVFKVNQWPPELPVTRALGRQFASFRYAMPIRLGNADEPGVEHYPLVVVRDPELRIERRLFDLGKVELDDTTRRNEQLIGAAAQRGERRLAVVADPVWACDALTTGAGGLAHPANSELFVNSVCWLAHRDQLIAASARSRAIPRIGNVSPRSVALMKWSLTAGLPLIVLAAGLIMWLVRRRG